MRSRALYANLAAVGRVLNGYSEHSGFQTVIVLCWLPTLKEMTAWKAGYPAYGLTSAKDAKGLR